MALGIPTFDDATTARLARDLYGLDATVSPLTSERDQNVLLSVGGQPRLVLKIANANEARAFLEAEQRAMQHATAHGARTPGVAAMLDGRTLAGITPPDGPEHLVWAIDAMPGQPLARVALRTPALWREFGGQVAALAQALEGFDDPALHREFHWDLAAGREVVERHRGLLTDPVVRVALDVIIHRFDQHVAPLVDGLARSVIHGDLNDYNVLVGGGADLYDRSQHVTGLLDFGDMVHGFTIGDLSIALAYAMLDAEDPLSVACELTRGYHAVRPIGESELQTVWGLALLRLCMSAVLASRQQRDNPGNEYLGVSQRPLARTLPRLAKVPFAFATGTLRNACGVEPIPTSARVREWLGANTERFAPVLGLDVRTAPTLVLDLGVGSALVHGDPRENEEPPFSARIEAEMRAAGVRVAVGQYDEPRLVYATPAFAEGDGTTNEHRTVHIGLDLFAAAGTTVHAPIDGVVAVVENHAIPLDYGGTVLLKHETGDGTPFWTLCGHLSPASTEGLRVGDRVAAGQRIATLGTAAENGGWPPHLHLQVITDLLDERKNFPGVGTPTHRDVWRSVSPDPNLIVGIPADRFPKPLPPPSETLERRRALVGPSLSIAYQRPVRIVRGWKQFLFDDDGRRYLDAYNNVPHVGHAHPHVVRAAARQMAVLNTNTRYLHDALETYAERLTATLPDPLRVAFLVSSASEANELALRLVRAATGRKDMLVLEAAYHGNTTSLIDISPYKHAGPGGSGAPDWVHVAPLADDYRGPYKRNDPDAGAKYARDLSMQIRYIREHGRELAGFIAESCPSVGGQLFFPKGYLAGVYAAVREAGALCIADEVQTGLGRIGTHCWAFEQQGVVPDIVVMGKPIGNGHPLAAVVTTRAIADAFNNGMEYFSTFGGNTVSCVVGNAVLDVVEREQLQAHALRVGTHLLEALRALAPTHAIVGDVRGSGLFLGVELVRDRDTLEPAGAEASYVVNRMRDHQILLGTDGPHHNVVKIRPPMPFDEADADRLVETLDDVLGELAR